VSTRDWLSLYLGEARDLIAQGAEALALPLHVGREPLLRAAHTLKGMSATMGFGGLASEFHAIEDLAAATDDAATLARRWQAVADLHDRAAAIGNDAELRAWGGAPKPGGEPAAALTWIELVPRDDEPMPRARLFQWHRELSSWGVRELMPEAAALGRSDAPLSLRLRADSELLARVQTLPRLGELRMLPEPERPNDVESIRTHSLRIDLTELDALFAELGELHTELRVLRATPHGGREWERGMRTSQGLVARALHRASGMRLSTLEPLMDVFTAAAEDAARRLDRSVVISRDGDRMRVAREVIERLHPLLPHVARNCVAHGLEPADERVAAGKPAAGSLRIAAEQHGAMVRLRITDDGRGVDQAHLARLAADAGLDVARLDSGQLHQLLFRGGSSRADRVDEVSGRGVGLAAVREAVRAARGNIRADSRPGEGFTLEIELPLPLSLLPLLEVRIGAAVVGMLDAGWSALPASEAPDHRLPGIPQGTGLHLVREGARLAVDEVRSLGNVWVHAVRPPLSRMEGVVGFFLDEQGRPGLVLEPLPLAVPTTPSLRFWGRGLQAIRAVLRGLDDAAATAWLPDPERPQRAWQVIWPDRRRVVLSLVDPGPETARRLFGLRADDPPDAMDEQANWIITRALESDGVSHQELMAGGPPRLTETPAPARAGSQIDACALSGDDGRTRLVLWREEWAS
jgi:signal transduction histidine kinase/HPt (histidine-containing phosphotransfer) domain-containing protein